MSWKKKKKRRSIIIRKHFSIGTGDTVTDNVFHQECYVDTGDLDLIKDISDNRRILLGRTGSGKTALFQRLAQLEQNVISLSPENLSLHHISNSNIIKLLNEMGIHLEVFYILLWMHIITIELIKRRYNINTRKNKETLLARLLGQIGKNSSKAKAVKYIEQWGDRFWDETQERVRQFTEKLEGEICGEMGAKFGKASISMGAGQTFSEEEKFQIETKAKNVVNKIQLQELTNLIDLLGDEIFYDVQNKYFLTIDNLDEEWAEEHMRYSLIKALIDVLRKFHKIRSVKIIIALRNDLYAKVIEDTKTPGSQEEKYEGLIYRISWTKDQLKSVLDQRLRYLFGEKFQDSSVGIDRLLPDNQMDRTSAIDYILNRTFMRPREAIQFINECIAVADGKTRLTVENIRTAERNYSEKRIRSLLDEWRLLYPNLGDYLKVLERKKRAFHVEDISDGEIDDFVVKSVDDSNRLHGPMYEISRSYWDEKMGRVQVALRLLHHLYFVGAVGIKSEAFKETHWSYKDLTPVSPGQFSADSTYHVHPTFWMALGNSPK